MRGMYDKYIPAFCRQSQIYLYLHSTCSSRRALNASRFREVSIYAIHKIRYIVIYAIIIIMIVKPTHSKDEK